MKHKIDITNLEPSNKPVYEYFLESNKKSNMLASAFAMILIILGVILIIIDHNLHTVLSGLSFLFIYLGVQYFYKIFRS
jgi:hypothetical protein